MPEGLFLSRINFAGPSYVASICILAVKVTNLSVIHSPCAVALARPITVPSVSRACIGNCPSKNHAPGATPATVKKCPTVLLACGDVTTTCAESGCEEGGDSFSTFEAGACSCSVEVAMMIAGDGLEVGSTIRKLVIMTMPTKRIEIIIHHIFVDIIETITSFVTFLLYRSY